MVLKRLSRREIYAIAYNVGLVFCRRTPEEVNKVIYLLLKLNIDQIK